MCGKFRYNKGLRQYRVFGIDEGRDVNIPNMRYAEYHSSGMAVAEDKP